LLPTIIALATKFNQSHAPAQLSQPGKGEAVAQQSCLFTVGVDQIARLFTPEDQQAIIRQVLNKQQADGGWRSATLYGDGTDGRGVHW
jgi:hypothetical protein